MSEEWMREGPFQPDSLANPNKLVQILSPLDAKKNNTRWANAAVHEAKSALRLSSNKGWDELRSLGGALICVGIMRRETDKSVSSTAGIDALRVIADTARKHGCGNCGELSAIAFMWLYDRRIKVTLDWMKINNGDHQFVLIDRAAGDVTDPKKWGERCVIADPWKDVVKPGPEIEQLEQGKNYASVLRIDLSNYP